MDDIVTWLRARAADEANNDEAAKLWAAADLISRLTKERDERFEHAIGDEVEKVSGYRWPGVVVSRFMTLAGQLRYVVECTVPEVAGALHIYARAQIAAIRQKSDVPTDVNDMPGGEKL